MLTLLVQNIDLPIDRRGLAAIGEGQCIRVNAGGHNTSRSVYPGIPKDVASDYAQVIG